MVEKNQAEVLQPSDAEAAPKKIRGRPFQRGNPGRPRGSKNRTTRLLEELVAGEAEKLAQKAVELALAGNVKCLHFCLDRLLPRPDRSTSRCRLSKTRAMSSQRWL